MAVTIQQIADKAGVSRGTVDRALNGRGRINPEVAAQIKQLAEELGYAPKVKKSEEQARRNIKIGIITQLAASSFMSEINKGIQEAVEELKEMGVEILLKESKTVDEVEQLQAIEQLVEAGVQGLAIMPVECEAVRERLNRLIEEQKVPVVTFNSDMVGLKRNCFVGMDNRKSGQTAAGLMAMLTRGVGKVLIITGSFSNHVNNTRVDGFISEIKRSCTTLEIAGVQGSFDEAVEVERIIENTLRDVPGINGIFIVSAGQEGVGRAFEKLNLERRPYVIVYDQTPANEAALLNNTVDFLIDQNGYVQGYKPPYILASILLRDREPEEEFIFTDINIKTQYNL